MVTEVALSLGANLGNRLSHMRIARDKLKSISVGSYCEQSPIYQSSPVDCPENSPDYYNAVVVIRYDRSCLDLLDICQKLELQMGRLPKELRKQQNEPRSLDVDILYFGDQEIQDDRLHVPHPRMTKRRFVLKPLSDLRSELVLPKDMVDIDYHLKNLRSDEPHLKIVQASW